MAGIKSERRPASDRNTWPPSNRNRWPVPSEYAATHAAQSAVAVTRETAEKQLRAYVMVESCVMTGVRPGNVPIGKVVLKNSGNTPASNLKGVVYSEIRPFPNHGLSFSVDQNHSVSSMVLGPGSTYDYTVNGSEEHLSSNAYNCIRRGTIAVYLWGEFWYCDGFSNHMRMTKFRSFCTGISGDGSLSMTPMSEGSDFT